MTRIGFLQDMLSSVFSRASLTVCAESLSTAELCDALLTERGEVSGQQLASLVLQRFSDADAEGRLEFFTMLATRFDIEADQVLEAATRFADDNGAGQLAVLLDAVEPRRRKLFRRLNRVPDGTRQLVRMREQLLDVRKTHPDLARIDLDFQHLFQSWFNQGFLVLREIDWTTSAHILEKIIAYEAVHAINSWSALRSRLEPTDRKCFAFFHPAMPDEPLVFVQVALTDRDPTSIRELLQPDRVTVDPLGASRAVFYSISNCQRGLVGISFGHSLLKHVVQELTRQNPSLTTFRTLSPLPGFVSWVQKQAEERRAQDAGDQGDIGIDQQSLGADARGNNGIDPEAIHWVERVADGRLSDPDERQLRLIVQLAAHYLMDARRQDDQPVNPVARFHLGNGAVLDQLLPMADRFDKGLQASAGMMVSYLYDPAQLEANHEAYAARREVVTSKTIKGLRSKGKPDTRSRLAASGQT